jgi:hypothetical protein
MFFEQEHEELARPQDACREFARNVGHERPERAWILTDFDTWERNPYYHGPPQPHPEDDAHWLHGAPPRDIDPELAAERAALVAGIPADDDVPF